MIGLPPSWFQTLRRQAQRRPDGRHVLQLSELPRVDRERLLAQGFVREVIKGWLISAIRLEDRDAYMKALESASIAADRPFATFSGDRVKASMEQSEKTSQMSFA
jgi:hypothetical protein